MSIRKRKIFNKEIIGKEITVMNSTSKSLVGIKGIVVNETKNTLVIESKGEKKTLLKSTITFRIDNEVLNGKNIIVRPENRI